MTNQEILTKASPADNDEAYQAFLEVQKSLEDAKVPTDGRVAYYYAWSWWRHPIKRWKQKRAFKKLDEHI